MTRGIVTKLLLLAVFAAVVFFGCVGIQSLERLRESNLTLAAEISRQNSRTAALPAAENSNNKYADIPGDNIANYRFFVPDAPVKGILTRAYTAEPPNFNPVISNEATAAMFAGICSASLAERNWENPEVFEPLLAEKWEISNDKKEFRIKLRKGVKFHSFTDPDTGRKVDGVEVTAHDFKFMIDVIKNPDVNAAPLRSYYKNLESIEVINDYEFTVKWATAYYNALGATLSLTPLPRFFYLDRDGKFDGRRFNSDHRRNSMIVNCGPYFLESYEKNKKAVFRRNPDYFGNRAGVGAKLETLEYVLINHPGTRFQALAAGQLDALELTPDQWVKRGNDKIFTDGKINKYQYLLPQYTYIGYNQKNPLFRSRLVRQALTLLTDREKIAREIYFGLAEIVNGPFFPQSKYYDRSIAPWPYDPAKAVELLQQDGWRDIDGDGVLEKDGRKFVFTMLQVANHPMQQRMLPILKESFAAAGIDMKIQTVEWSVYIQHLENRSYDACTLGWSSSFDPDLFQVWHSSQMAPGGSNHISYSNRELDALIEKLQQTFDFDLRIKIAHEISRILHEDQPYTFLFCPYSLSAINAKYRNVRVFPTGIPEIIFYLP